MKYFKDGDGNVYAFEDDGSQDEFINSTLIGITELQANSIRFASETIDVMRIKSLAAVDYACGIARSKAVSGGEYIAEEYRRAYEDALTFQTAGFTGRVPLSIQVWATVAGITPQASAEEIIAARNGYMALLDAIRSIRLIGKAEVEAAATSDAILAAVATVNASLAALP